jgi:hypothetical protein
VGHDKEDRDRKSRFVLKRLKSGKIPFRRNGEVYCPFCGRVITKNLESMIQHVNGIGVGSKRKHVAYGRFLEKFVKGGLIPVSGPAVGPHVLFSKD